jgi:CRISPR-associated protein Csc2
MLLYVLHNILNTEKYGARETRSGKNIDNEILGVILGDHSTSLSTGELLMNYDTENVEEAVGSYINDAQKADWEVYSDQLGFDDFPDWFHEMKEVASLQAEDSRDRLKEELQELTEKAREVHRED